MNKIKFISCLLSAIISLGLLCSCGGATGPQGPQGETGATGKSAYEIWLDEGFEGTELDFLNWLKDEQGSTGKGGSSFLTGKGQPSNDFGEVGDSYLDLCGSEEWDFYIKNEDGWKLMGVIEVEAAPLTMEDLNGTYELSHVFSSGRRYNIGDTIFGLTLTSDMIQAELNNSTGHLSVDIVSVADTDITCTIEYYKLIMICEDAINITGHPSSVYELSIVQDGEIYLVLESYGDYYYVKKVS